MLCRMRKIDIFAEGAASFSLEGDANNLGSCTLSPSISLHILEAHNPKIHISMFTIHTSCFSSESDVNNRRLCVKENDFSKGWFLDSEVTTKKMEGCWLKI